MGKQNIAMYRYLDDEVRFADLFNATQFAGEDIVDAGKLKEASEHYVKPPRKETFRDLKKRLEDGTELRILAVENQNQVDYTMPWRLMDYDNSEYDRQVKRIQKKNEAESGQKGAKKLEKAERLCRFRKSDKLAPVYTICLYHGQEKWDGPRCLSDMMEFGEGSEAWKQMFADYPIRLVCVNELTDFSHFKSSLGKLFKVLALQSDRKAMRKLIAEAPEYRLVDSDTVEAIKIMTKSEELFANIDDYKNEEGEYEMCRAFKEWMADERQQGMEQGIQVVIKTYQEFGKSYAESKQKITEEFALHEASAQEYMKKYWKE